MLVILLIFSFCLRQQGVMFSGCPSVRPLTSISPDAIAIYLGNSIWK